MGASQEPVRPVGVRVIDNLNSLTKEDLDELIISGVLCVYESDDLYNMEGDYTERHRNMSFLLTGEVWEAFVSKYGDAIQALANQVDDVIETWVQTLIAEGKVYDLVGED